VSHERLKSFCPHLYGWSGLSPARRRDRRYLIEHMLYGDSRAAVVVSVEPLLVAAYTDELDCVALLRFPSNAASQRVEIGSRLLTVNTYGRGDRYSADLIPGPARIERWVRFHPIIADFICADPDQVKAPQARDCRRRVGTDAAPRSRVPGRPPRADSRRLTLPIWDRRIRRTLNSKRHFARVARVRDPFRWSRTDMPANSRRSASPCAPLASVRCRP
jgi:hypothetical protein